MSYSAFHLVHQQVQPHAPEEIHHWIKQAAHNVEWKQVPTMQRVEVDAAAFWVIDGLGKEMVKVNEIR